MTTTMSQRNECLTRHNRDDKLSYQIDVDRNCLEFNIFLNQPNEAGAPRTRVRLWVWYFSYEGGGGRCTVSIGRQALFSKGSFSF